MDCTSVNILFVILYYSFAKCHHWGHWTMYKRDHAILFPTTACKSKIISKNSHLKTLKKINYILKFKEKTKSYTKYFPKFPLRMAKYFGAFRNELHFSRK